MTTFAAAGPTSPEAINATTSGRTEFGRDRPAVRDRRAPHLAGSSAAPRISRLNASRRFASIADAIREIAAGRPVVVVDDENRENEGDLLFAAELVTPELVAFTMTECRGLLCVPMEGATLDRLELPTWSSTTPNGTAPRTP